VKWQRKALQLEHGIWVWTVNCESEIKEALQFNIDGIITANAELIREVLA